MAGNSDFPHVIVISFFYTFVKVKNMNQLKEISQVNNRGSKEKGDVVL